jgi:OmpA-OmpF porin, OOP family
MSARLSTGVLFYVPPLWTRNDFGQTLPAPKPFSRQALSMKFSTFLLAATTLALPGVAAAQPVTGLYVGAGAGANLLQNESLSAVPGLQPKRSLTFDTGFAGNASIGWGFGNGLRAEVEGDFLTNHVSGIKGSSSAQRAGGFEQEYGGMVNTLYDFNFGLPIYPYIGVGVGGQILEDNHINFSDIGASIPHGGSASVGAFAYQAIAGASFPLPWVTGLSLTAEYRMLGLVDPLPALPETIVSSTGRIVARDHNKFGNVFNHQLLLGVRYAFDTAPPPPPPAPVVPQVQTAPARTYLVFFDWDRSDLTDRAQQIIAEAAQASTHVQYTRIEVQGNADRSGTPAYNQGLSLRRAQTVAAELVRQGVPRTAIDIQAFGDTRPLVPTAAGVREPQNRRVAIILH